MERDRTDLWGSMGSSEVRGVVASTNDQGRHLEGDRGTSSLGRSVLPRLTILVVSTPSPFTAPDTIDPIVPLDEITPRASLSFSLFLSLSERAESLFASQDPHFSFFARTRTETPLRSGHRTEATRTASKSSKPTKLPHGTTHASDDARTRQEPDSSPSRPNKRARRSK